MQTVDGRNLRGPVQETEQGEEFYHRERGRSGSPGYAWPNVEGVDYQRMMYNAFGRADSLHREAADNAQNFEAWDEMEVQEGDEVDYENLI